MSGEEERFAANGAVMASMTPEMRAKYEEAEGGPREQPAWLGMPLAALGVVQIIAYVFGVPEAFTAARMLPILGAMIFLTLIDIARVRGDAEPPPPYRWSSLEARSRVLLISTSLIVAVTVEAAFGRDG